MTDLSSSTERTSVWTALGDRLRTGRRWPFAAVGVVALLLLLLGTAALARSGEALPGVHVEGVPVGGLGPEAIRDVVVELAEERQTATVTVTAADQSFEFTPGEAGYTVDVDATVEAALNAGRDSGLGALVSHVTATFGSTFDVPLEATSDAVVAERFVADVAAQVDRDTFAGSVRVAPDSLTVVAEDPHHGREVARDDAVTMLADRIGEPDPEPAELPVVVTEPPTDAADVAAAAERAATAVSEPLVLSANGASATLSPSEIAQVLVSEERDGAIVLTADADVLAELLADDLPALEVTPQDATFEVVSGLATFDNQGDATWSPRPAELRVVPSAPGQRYDPATGAAQVGELLDTGVHAAELRLETVPADLTTEDAEGLEINQLIGTFTTYHACCQSRVTNIQRLADLVRGHVLRPGETFSVNEDIGQRTREKGFVPAGAIFQGEIRDELGGGVSQFATTMYNASFFAGIPILDYRAHSLYISRYPLGREATLNFPSIDLKIENDTDHGLYIHTSYTPTSITVSLFGNNGGREVSAIMGSPYDYRGYDTRRRANPNMPAGSERVVQSGTQGYSVKVVRVIREDGDERREEIFTRYLPRPQIIEYGTGAPPPPPPEEPPPPSEPPPSEPPPSEPEPDNPPPDNGN